MNPIRRTTALGLVVTAMFVANCGPAPVAPTPAPSAQPTVASPTEVPAKATRTPQPTQGPTVTVWPPIFDPYGLEDIRGLDSFAATVNEKNTVNGQLTELTTEIGYIQEPYSAYAETDFGSGETRTYQVDGRTYHVNGGGDWYLSTRTDMNDVLYKLDIPSGNTERLAGAIFAGEEDYQGIPAYHFVFDQAAQPNSGSTLEGDFYLAQDGNYVLYSHWKETTSQGDFSQVYEVTEALSSINEVPDITLPSDLQEMKTALDLPAELDLPLPPDSGLDGLIRYRSGIGVDLYYFKTPRMSLDAFLVYYRNLAPTDGWTVSHVGHVNLHQDDCEFSRECVIVNKGSTQVVLYYDGATIRAEFDWPHHYHPL